METIIYVTVVTEKEKHRWNNYKTMVQCETYSRELATKDSPVEGDFRCQADAVDSFEMKGVDNEVYLCESHLEQARKAGIIIED